MSFATKNNTAKSINPRGIPKTIHKNFIDFFMLFSLSCESKPFAVSFYFHKSSFHIRRRITLCNIIRFKIFAHNTSFAGFPYCLFNKHIRYPVTKPIEQNQKQISARAINYQRFYTKVIDDYYTEYYQKNYKLSSE